MLELTQSYILWLLKWVLSPDWVICRAASCPDTSSSHVIAVLPSGIPLAPKVTHRRVEAEESQFPGSGFWSAVTSAARHRFALALHHSTNNPK
ncbi:MAG: hypothetical protein ACRD6N_10635, partial [Pyrinomonadaceae bacterium]